MFWQTPDVATKPEIDLACWAVVETDKGERHLVGIELATGAWQVSSAIEAFDTSAMEFRTISGRLYRMRDASTSADDARYAWDQWLPLMECSHGGRN
ncbi:hypothetical protein LMG23994_04472 [Cupriavidus pinatubonensis]|uniref:Uncharacterized protein n=1 Tax=Cupriavidus pinatubonensis TaxID=248026 RepID=A0ABN7Z7F7_9BURK|nr:hypothetical protein LMG23994_04472 [Cupriavidus pinatubonensis]